MQPRETPVTALPRLGELFKRISTPTWLLCKAREPQNYRLTVASDQLTAQSWTTPYRLHAADSYLSQDHSFDNASQHASSVKPHAVPVLRCGWGIHIWEQHRSKAGRTHLSPSVPPQDPRSQPAAHWSCKQSSQTLGHRPPLQWSPEHLHRGNSSSSLKGFTGEQGTRHTSWLNIPTSSNNVKLF